MNSVQTRRIAPPKFQHGFSLLEVIIVIAILGVIASIATVGVNRFRDSSNSTKLHSDIATVNTAIKVYLASGGDLTGVTNPQAVLDKLKTSRTEESAAKYAGLRSSMIDKRLTVVMQTSSEASTDAARAVWNPDKNRFEAATTGLGVKAFDINAALGQVDYGEETREASAVDYNEGDGWIWTFVETPGAAPPTPDQIAVGGGNPLPPDPPGSPVRLIKPVISPTGGEYIIGDFPLAVTISNPNDESISDLYWATEWSGGSGILWQAYTGPVQVQPDDQLLVYVKSLDSVHLDSYSVGANFVAKSVQLQAPGIQTSASELDLASNSPVTIQLTDPNSSAEPHELRYRLPGGDWTVYTGPFAVKPSAYPTGFRVEAFAAGLSTGYQDSEVVSRSLPIKLKAPVIELSDLAFTSLINTITITITNPNPSGSSVTKYKLTNVKTGQESAWIDFGSPLRLSATDYLDGFTVVAFSSPLSADFLESDTASSVANSFFGAGIDGYTIFVLDTSGSMNWLDGIGLVKSEVLNSLLSYPSEGKFAVVTFNQQSKVVYPWSSANPLNIASAVLAIKPLSAGGSTNYSAALDSSLGIINSAGDVRQVIFLSDGKPTRGDNESGILSRIDAMASKGVKVDTIGFHIEESGKQLLKDMAARGNGTFSEVE